MASTLVEQIVGILKKGPKTRRQIEEALAAEGVDMPGRVLLGRLSRLRQRGVLSNEHPGSALWQLPNGRGGRA